MQFIPLRGVNMILPLYVYGNTLVEFAAYFSTRSVRGLSYTLLTAIEN